PGGPASAWRCPSTPAPTMAALRARRATATVSLLAVPRAAAAEMPAISRDGGNASAARTVAPTSAPGKAADAGRIEQAAPNRPGAAGRHEPGGRGAPGRAAPAGPGAAAARAAGAP